MTSPQQLDLLATDQRTAGYGWLGTVGDFLSLSPETWLDSTVAQHQRLYHRPPTQTQRQTWQDTAAVLSEALGHPHQRSWVLIFEYELPREGGRRPDVLLLAGEQIWVMEFILWTVEE